MTGLNLTSLGDGPEFDRIREIWRSLGDRGSGGGDDCAIIDVGGEQLAISTDMMVEETHFKVSWLSPREIGWRAGAAALSDLAAVSATPLAVLVSLGVPDSLPRESVAQLVEGLGAVTDSVGGVVSGGDLVRSRGIVVDVIVLGRAATPVFRNGAAEGDTLWVTGSLGGPATAVEAWERGEQPGASARSRFARPEPRIKEAAWLRERGAKALIDLSDGLVADAGHIAAASGVACVIEAAKVPVHPSATVETALLGGEEFELLAVLPQDVDAALGTEFERTFGFGLTGIGHVEDGTGIRVLNAGVPMKLGSGFSHFKS